MARTVAHLPGVAPDLLLSGEREQRLGRLTASAKVSRWIPAAIFVSALLLRAAFFTAHSRPLQSDEIDYDELGWTLATTGAYSSQGHPTAYRPIGYPASIAAVYAIAGRNPLAVKWAQAILDSGTAVLLFALFSRRHRAAGFIAGVAWAWFPAAILFTDQLFSESLLVFFLVGFFYVASRDDAKPWLARAGGLLLGGLILIKPLVMSLFAVAAPYALDPKRPRRRVAMLAFAFLPVALWIARNALVMGAPVLTTSAGVNLFIGNHRGATGSYAPVDAATAPPEGRTEIQNDAFAGRAALDDMARDPFGTAARAVRKVLLLATSEGELVVGHFAKDDGRYRERFRSVPAWIHLLVSVPSALVLVLGVLGLLTRAPDRTSRLFYALLVGTVLSTIIFFGGSRFRFPLMAPLVGFAAEFSCAWRAGAVAFTKRKLVLATATIGTFLAVWACEIYLLTAA